MAENKKSFILYADMQGLVNQLPDEIAGKLLKHIYSYVNDENPISDDLLLNIAFEPIKQQLKRDLQEWEVIKSDRSKSGILGNLKRWNTDLYNKVMIKELTIEEAEVIAKSRKASHPDKKNPDPIKNIANVAVNVNDNVNDNVNVNVNGSVDVNTATPPKILSLENSNLYRKPTIPTIQQVKDAFLINKGTVEMAEKFYQKNSATGWYYQNNPITNFIWLVPKFIEAWEINNKNKTNGSQVKNQTIKID